MIDKSFIATYLTDKEYYSFQSLKLDVKHEEDQTTKDQKEAELDRLEAKAIKAYIKQYPTSDAVLEELQGVFDQLEKEDFIEHCNRAAGIAERLKTYDKSGDDGKPAGTDETGRSLNAFIAYFEDTAKETFENFFVFMVETFCLYRMAAIAVINGIEDYNNAHIWEMLPDGQGRVISQMIIASYRSFYPDAKDIPEVEDAQPITSPKAKPPQKILEEYMPMFHSTAMDEMARFTRRDARPDRITGNALIVGDDVKLLVKGWDKLAASLGINTHKLLCTAVALFTRYNNVGNKESRKTYTISIPLKEYCTLLGYLNDDAAQDTKRMQNALKDAKKKIRKDLELLRSSDITVPGRNGDFITVAIIGTYSIKQGYIHITLDPVFAEYLVKLPITPYPAMLLGIDARKPNAYLIGLKLSEYFCMDRNQRTGQADRIKVKNILKATQLPTIKEVRESRKGWEERIKEPFERTLDFLTASGFLTNWEYCKPKGEPIPDNEAAFDNYEAWSNTLLHFTLANSESLSQQIKDRVERSIDRAEKKTKAKRGTGKKTAGK